MKVHFQALGCRLNEAEQESWSNEFIARGYQLARNSDEADLVVFNSCSVTAQADRKSRQLINRVHKNNPHSRLVVTGCYASLQPQQVASQLGVDLVVANHNKEQLVDRVIEQLQLPQQVQDSPSMDEHSLFARGRHRAFIKVQDGCRYRCTFCIVTIARGEERSRQVRDIVAEINRHHQQGVQEVVITGVHVGGYGSDLGTNLYQLLSEILDKTCIPHIRLASVEPWDLPDNFFTLFKNPRLMPHMHLPLQSGSDSVLRRMARRCKTMEFATLVDNARSGIPFFNVTTDLIVGFPGESEAEWKETVQFVEQVGFGHIHIFNYSPRAGTKAANLANQVPKEIARERSMQMHAIAKMQKRLFLSKMLGSTAEVLWESKSDEMTDSWVGYSPNYHKVICPQGSSFSSKISSAKIVDISPDGGYLVGQAVG